MAALKNLDKNADTTSPLLFPSGLEKYFAEDFLYF
jgi:hypothetical protein